MLIVFLIFVMLCICVVFYRPGAKFFFCWLAFCAIVFYFVRPSVGLWGFLMYFVVMPDPDADSKKRKQRESFSNQFAHMESESLDIRSASGYRGSSQRYGDITNFSTGNSSVHYGDVSYHDNKTRSVRSGDVTYYYDEISGRELGHSVDRGNGVCNYYNSNGKEVGRSVTKGNTTDYYDDCFEI